MQTEKFWYINLGTHCMWSESIFRLHASECLSYKHCMQEYSWSFASNFYECSKDQVWQSCFSLEGSIQKQSGFICILNVLGVITYCFQQSFFSLLYCCRVYQCIFFCQSVGDPSTGKYEVICTFQCHSQSYGGVCLTTASLYMAVLDKICTSSFNQDHFMYFIIFKTDRIEWNTNCYFPPLSELCFYIFSVLYEALWKMPVVSSHCNYFS